MQIIRAHLILGTVTEEGLREQLQTARSVRFLSLDRDYSWTFTTGPGGGLALVDPRNPPIAEDGLLEAEVGVVAATPPGRWCATCPPCSEPAASCEAQGLTARARTRAVRMRSS